MHYQDEEEDEDDEMMSEHMRDSEVRCSSCAGARCVLRDFN